MFSKARASSGLTRYSCAPQAQTFGALHGIIYRSRRNHRQIRRYPAQPPKGVEAIVVAARQIEQHKIGPAGTLDSFQGLTTAARDLQIPGVGLAN